MLIEAGADLDATASVRVSLVTSEVARLAGTQRLASLVQPRGMIGRIRSVEVVPASGGYPPSLGTRIKAAVDPGSGAQSPSKELESEGLAPPVHPA